jgi:hypothetical protein
MLEESSNELRDTRCTLTSWLTRFVKVDYTVTYLACLELEDSFSCSQETAI